MSLFQELPLYCSGGLRFFWDNKFDHAMVAFLDCVQQFKEEVEKGETRFCLPYRWVLLHPVPNWHLVLSCSSNPPWEQLAAAVLSPSCPGVPCSSR